MRSACSQLWTGDPPQVSAAGKLAHGQLGRTPQLSDRQDATPVEVLRNAHERGAPLNLPRNDKRIGPSRGKRRAPSSGELRRRVRRVRVQHTASAPDSRAEFTYAAQARRALHGLLRTKLPVLSTSCPKLRVFDCCPVDDRARRRTPRRPPPLRRRVTVPMSMTATLRISHRFPRYPCGTGDDICIVHVPGTSRRPYPCLGVASALWYRGLDHRPSHPRQRSRALIYESGHHPLVS